MRTGALAACLLAAGCASTEEVRLDPIRLVGRQDTPRGPAVVVEAVSDAKAPTSRIRQLRLRFNVDGRGPLRVGRAPLNPYRIEDRLPFTAFPLPPGEKPDPRVTRWGVPLAAREDRDGTVFAYDLDDGRAHELTFQLHGYQPFGAYEWTSNETTLSLPQARP